MAGYLASNLLPPLAGIFGRNYLIALGSGLGLMLPALLSSLIWRLARRHA